MSRGMSRGGSGFPIIIAVLGVLILAVIGIFIYMQLSDGGDKALDNTLTTMEPTAETTAIPTVAPVTPEPATEEPVTVPPTTEPTQAIEATATQYITAPPSTSSGTVWINVDALQIHTAASFESDVVGKIPYGTSVSGDVSGKWMNTSYEGTSGYIYLGKTSAGRACVVYSESAIQALDPDPDASEVDLITSITRSSVDSAYMYVQIQFSSAVYSDDNATGNIVSADFEITNATLTTDNISSGTAPTSIITLKLQLLGSPSDVTVKVRAQSIFNASGEAAASESATFSTTP